MLQQSGLAVTWVRCRWCLLDMQAAPDDLSDLHFFLGLRGEEKKTIY